MKPKESTIFKINALFEKIYAAESFRNMDADSAEVLRALQSHVNTMNLHHAKVTYFSLVKAKLNHALELLNASALEELGEDVREMRKLL